MGLLSDLLLQHTNGPAIPGVDVPKESSEIGRWLFRHKGVNAEGEAKPWTAARTVAGVVFPEERQAAELQSTTPCSTSRSLETPST